MSLARLLTSNSSEETQTSASVPPPYGNQPQGITPTTAGVPSSVMEISIFALVLMLLPIPVGIGIINVKRWGWQLFLGYASLLILYNLQVFVFNFKLYNLAALFNSIIGFIAIFYFVRKDISAPYFKMYRRSSGSISGKS